jgi:hypothetical protein
MNREAIRTRRRRALHQANDAEGRSFEMVEVMV